MYRKSFDREREFAGPRGERIIVRERDIPARTDRWTAVELPPVGTPEDGDPIEVEMWPEDWDLDDIKVHVTVYGAATSKQAEQWARLQRFDPWDQEIHNKMRAVLMEGSE